MTKAHSTLFFGITGIDIPFSSIPGIKVSGDIRLIKDLESISRLIGEFEDCIGGVEASFLRGHASALGYRHEVLEIVGQNNSEYLNGVLLRALEQIHTWLLRLWLVKDHSINLDLAWLSARVGKERVTNNNRWVTASSNASGRMENTSFNRSELKEADSINLQHKHWSTGPVKLDIDSCQGPSITMLSSGSLRFQRFLYFMFAGRSNTDVAMKVAHWCSGLETLVSSSHTELSHQVAERAACALHPAGLDRIETFQLVKSAYNMRSKAVHGAPFKDKEAENLLRISVNLDSICRKLARLYFEDEKFRLVVEGDKKVFDEFWLRRILS